MNKTEDIGKRIKIIRGDVTQKSFAELLGVTGKTIIRYESGERLPDAEFLIKLNVLYKVQPLWVLTGQGDDVTGEKLTLDEAVLLDNYRRSPPEGQAAIKVTSAAFAKSNGKVAKVSKR